MQHSHPEAVAAMKDIGGAYSELPCLTSENQLLDLELQFFWSKSSGPDSVLEFL